MSANARLGVAVVAGCTVTNVAFVAPMWDPWTRLIIVLSILGLVGLMVSWNESSVWRRPSAGGLVLAVGSGVVMAIVAALLTTFGPIRAQIAFLTYLTGGHTRAALAVSLPLAVLGEELFWRATVLRLAEARLGMVAGVLVACAAYGLAHVASGTVLLPLAAFGAGVVWAVLLLALRNLAAPIASHFILDVLVVLAVLK